MRPSLFAELKQRDTWLIIRKIAVISIRVRYKNSFLGVFWGLLSPLMYLLIFTFVFSNVFSDIENYPLYALTGLIFWSFFASTAQQMTMSVLESSGVLKSIHIPPLTYPLGTLLAQLINLGFIAVPFLILMTYFGYQPHWQNLLVFPLLIIFIMFVLGIGLLLSSFNVYFRDVNILLQVIMPALFYATPIAYSYQLIPPAYLWILKFNPMFHYINAFRDALYYHQSPDLNSWIIISAMGIISLILGLAAFKKLEPGFISNY